MTDSNTDLAALTVDLVSSYVANNNLRAEDVPGFIAATHAAIAGISNASVAAEALASSEHVAAVSVRKSLASKDHIISLIDGKPYKTLRRHLSGHGLSPQEYRQRYGLKSDYPMVAQSYSEMRRTLAQKIGLGRKAKTAPAPSKPVATKPKAVRPRKPAAATATA